MAAVAVAMLVLTGCSSGPEPLPSGSPTGTASPSPSPSSSTPSTTSSSPSTSPTPTSTPSPTLTGFGTATVRGGTDWPGPVQARLERVAVGTHDGYDRLVLQFATGPVPTFEVSTQAEPVFHRDASDEEVRLRGDSGVLVVLRGTTVASTARTWILTTYPAIREVEQVGNFEAVVSYAVGVAGTARIRVTTLTSPARLVVDVLQP